MFELFGIGVIYLVLGLAGGVYLGMKKVAPKTSWTWDDEVIDTIEGLADTVGVDVDKLAEKSIGRLKKKLKNKM